MTAKEKLRRLAKAVMEWQEADDFVKAHGWGAVWGDGVVDDVWDERRSLMCALADSLEEHEKK